MSRHQGSDLNTEMPLIEVYQPADDIYTINVRHADVDQFPNAHASVDVGPTPTWMSPSEINDAVAEAVRQVLDMAWESATGEKVQR